MRRPSGPLDPRETGPEAPRRPDRSRAFRERRQRKCEIDSLGEAVAIEILPDQRAQSFLSGDRARRLHLSSEIFPDPRCALIIGP